MGAANRVVSERTLLSSIAMMARITEEKLRWLVSDVSFSLVFQLLAYFLLKPYTKNVSSQTRVYSQNTHPNLLSG